jgi:hypothetical protein
LQDTSSDEEMPEQPVGRASHQEEEDSGSDGEAPAPKKHLAGAKAQTKPAAKSSSKAIDLEEEDSESEDDLLPRKKASAGSKVTPLPPLYLHFLLLKCQKSGGKQDKGVVYRHLGNRHGKGLQNFPQNKRRQSITMLVLPEVVHKGCQCNRGCLTCNSTKRSNAVGWAGFG